MPRCWPTDRGFAPPRSCQKCDMTTKSQSSSARIQDLCLVFLIMRPRHGKYLPNVEPVTISMKYKHEIGQRFDT
eukprot:3987033-Pleurochrysis_carterae.AAC.1